MGTNDRGRFDRDTWTVGRGWDVYGANGEKIGSVVDVERHYFTLEKGLLFKSDIYVPASAIAESGDGAVRLDVTKDEIESRGWGRPPEEPARYETAAGTTEASRQRAGFEGRTIEVPVAEEELRVRKHPEQRGRVRVEKDVVEERQTMDVPVREEEVHVERHRVDADAERGRVPRDAFQEQDFEVPVYGEEVDVSKEAVVREEVEISKTAEEHDEQVSDTVRRERVRVEGDDVDEARG